MECSYSVPKINYKIVLIHRLGQYLPQSALNTLYLTLIQPHFDYCLTVWGKCAIKHLTLLQRLQNRAARAVTGNFNFEVSPGNLINDLNWMRIDTRYTYFLGILVYKCLNNMAPKYLSELFHFHDNTRHYHTRVVTKHSLIIPRVELNVYKSTIAYRGPTLWNNLPTELKSSYTINMFKHSFKSLLKDNNLESF